MYTWMIRYEDEAALKEIEKMGTITFESGLPNFNFVIIESYLGRELFLKTSGIKSCEAPRMGTVNV